MFKKTCSAILALILFVSMCLPVSALESQKQSLEIHVLTEPVPSEVYSHVQTTIAGMVSDLYDLSAVKLGTPFKVYGSYYDLYYFVIYCSDKAVGTYRVFETENGYTGIFSESTEIINKLSQIPRASQSTPAKITAGNHDDLYAVVGSNIYSIHEDPAGIITQQSDLLTRANESRSAAVVNISDAISFNIPENSTRSVPTYLFLQIGYPETQGSSQNWCNAYCTASILRYKTGASVSSINAQSIMQWAYPNLSGSSLAAKALTTTQADNYANTHGINPTYTASTRTYTQVTTEIKSDNPLIFICDNVNTGAKKAHAFVCRGYNDNNGNSFYSVWNPWYTTYERIYTSDLTYVNSAGTERYLWSATMYDWD